MPVTSIELGTISFKSISYRFSGLLPITESLQDRYSVPTAARPDKPSIRNHEPLLAQISEPIPRVTLNLGSLPTRLFHGESRSVTLTVTNVGEEALDEVYVLTSHPAHVMVGSEAGATGSAGPSLLPLPPSALVGAGQRLQPGASLDVPLLVRGDEVGGNALRLLCAFRQDGREEAYATSDVHLLEVYPSLDVRSASRPSFKPDAPFTLDLDVSACGNPQPPCHRALNCPFPAQLHNAGLPADDVVIAAVSMYSQTWRIADGDFTSPVLAWQQSAAISLEVASATASDQFDDAGDCWSVKQVQTLLEGRDVTLSSSPAPLLVQSRAGGGVS